MYNCFSAVRGDKGDGLGSDSEGEGRQGSIWGKGHFNNRGSVEADSDFGTPQPQPRMTATASLWAGSPPSAAHATNWQPTPTISQEVPQVDPSPVVDRPLQPPKPKRTRVKGGRKNANAVVAGEVADGDVQPIVPPSLVPATPQSHSKHHRHREDTSADTQFQYSDLSMPAASSALKKKHPTGLSRTPSGAERPRGSARDSNRSIVVDYSLMNEDEGPAAQPDFSYPPPTPSQPHMTSSVHKKRPSPLPLETAPSVASHRQSTSSSQRRVPAAPSHHAGAQEMPPPTSPIRPEAKRRLLTVLMEDKRSDGMELAEIRVPLQPRGETLWVKAAHVVENLQSGPSRVDGPCKVHAMRGHFRQTFLRIEHDGREVFDDQQSLQVVEDGRGKTLSIYIESIPLPLASTPVYRRAPHEPSALHLDTNQSSHLPLTPHSTGPSPLLSHRVAQQKRKRMASGRDTSAAPENNAPDYNTGNEHFEVPSLVYEEPQQFYESSLASSSHKRLKSDAQTFHVAPSPHAAAPTGAEPAQLKRARSQSLIPKAPPQMQIRSSQRELYEGDAFSAPSPHPSSSSRTPAPTPGHRQPSIDLDAPPTISRMAESSGHTLGIGLPTTKMPPARGAPMPASASTAPTPEVVDISSRESSPESGHGSATSPLFSQASPSATDVHAPTSTTYSPAPFEPSQPPEDFNPVHSPAPAEPEPEPPAPPRPPPVNPAITHLMPFDISPTTYVASEMPSFTDNIDQMMAVRLTNTLRMDGFGFKDFQEKLTAGQALSNERALHWYRWVHEKVQKYANGIATGPVECGRRLIEPKHVLAAMQVTEDWYAIVRETLSMMMAYGPGGQRGAKPCVIQAAGDVKRGDIRLGVVRWTHLLLLLREVHDEWSRSQNVPRE